MNNVAVGPLNSVVNSDEQCNLSQKAENAGKKKKKKKKNANAKMCHGSKHSRSRLNR